MKLIELQKLLTERRIKIFSRHDLKVMLKISESAVHRILWRYVKKGVIVRLKGGLFALKFNFPSWQLIANKLYMPSYISLETALSHYALIPETVYSITSVTTRIPRRFYVQDVRFIYHKIKKEAFTGYSLARIGSEDVLLAEREKALVDYLYFVFLKKKTLNERLSLRRVIFKKILRYAALFQNPKFLLWIKNDFRRIHKSISR